MDFCWKIHGVFPSLGALIHGIEFVGRVCAPAPGSWIQSNPGALQLLLLEWLHQAKEERYKAQTHPTADGAVLHRAESQATIFEETHRKHICGHMEKSWAAHGSTLSDPEI